ncbi:MAG: SDR family oxidoreductase [Candidatus Latescibacteria bacterium]|jgi:3-oxoacyl-[acyl-carrier protein] reductase|nr:SDR family oxidoreductase [Candidatus Latescibacterota bacterium]
MNLNLKNKVAVITGGSRGIGRATALRFAEEGCKVAICARGQEGLDKAVEGLSKHKVEVFGKTADVSKPGETENFIQAAADALGSIDCLVNNVGGTAGSRDFATSDDAAWQETFDLNLFHAVRATRAALPHLKTGEGGSVVTISSISGWKPANSGAQYGATKAAEMFLAGALALELAPDKIRVNTVCPGSLFFPGGGWERFKETSPEKYETFRTREFPAQRLGSDFEVADVVVFVSSNRATWINGASIPVDGAQGRPNAF